MEAPAEEVIPDPTFMEIALRQAMDRAEKRKPQMSNRIKRVKDVDTDQDEIFDRTLKGKQIKD